MTLSLQPLPWDTEFFGIPVARLDLPEFDPASDAVAQLIATSPFELVYCFADPSVTDPSVFESRVPGSACVDEKVVFVKPLDDAAPPLPEGIISVHTVDEAITRLALQTGVYSRFRIDKHLPAGRFEQLYTEWIVKSVNRTIADEVYCYAPEGKELGLITLGKKNARADIGLIGVDEIARGQGIASKLMQAAEHYAISKGYSALQVVTQLKNKPACALYTKHGYTIASTVNIFHIWKSH